jgi:hypothetical protein
MAEIGERFVFPLQIGVLGDQRQLGVWGVAQIIARSDGEMLAAALEHFAETADAVVPTGVPLMQKRKIEEMPARVGEILFLDSSVPETWQSKGTGELSERARELASLYGKWRDPDAPMFEQMEAKDELGFVASTFGSLVRSVAIEWRFRFELEEVLAEIHGREARARRASDSRKPATWEDVARDEISDAYPEPLAEQLRAAYARLIDSIGGAGVSEQSLRDALAEFFESAMAPLHAAEYRDEIFERGARVAEACQGDRDLARAAWDAIA